jgi:hypothetical protein
MRLEAIAITGVPTIITPGGRLGIAASTVGRTAEATRPGYKLISRCHGAF